MFINNVVLAGNITRDPELRNTPGGTSVTDIGVAVNEHWTDNEGNKQEKAHFFDVTVWGKQAESVCQYLKKGDLVAVEGSLRQDRWTDTDGKNRSRVIVTAERVQFGPKRSKSNPGSDAAADEEAAKREAARKQFENNEGKTPTGDKPPF